MKYDRLKQKWFLEELERRRHSREMRSAIISRCTSLFRRFGLDKVILFGSVAEGRIRENSDIDILAFPLSADRYWLCRHELEQAIEYPVDLYTQDDDPKFVKKILERGEVIYEIQS